jgi:hypothetical protein
VHTATQSCSAGSWLLGKPGGSPRADAQLDVTSCWRPQASSSRAVSRFVPALTRLHGSKGRRDMRRQGIKRQDNRRSSVPSGQTTGSSHTIPEEPQETKRSWSIILPCPAICWRIVVTLDVPFRFMWMHTDANSRLPPFGRYWDEDTWDPPPAPHDVDQQSFNNLQMLYICILSHIAIFLPLFFSVFCAAYWCFLKHF